MAITLNENQVDTLLESVANRSVAANTGVAGDLAASASAALVADARDYDFKRPERVGKDQIRSLGAIHEGFARNFGASLSGVLRTIVDVRVVGVEQLTYTEFVNALPNPTCFIILKAPPLEGKMCLEISPLIVYPIIDRLLGGSSAAAFIPQRPLTAIEWRLIRRFADKALEHLSEAWRNLVEVEFGIAETESNPQLVHVVAPTEVVVFITLEIKMGACTGTMSLCIPFNVIEPVMSKLARQTWFGAKPKGATQAQVKRIQHNIARATVGVQVYLGQSSIRLSELQGLQPGDVIQLDKSVGQDAILQVEGRTKFAGSPGQFRGHRAISIRRAAGPDESL